MKRIPEPEIMDDLEQAKAYDDADFEEPHNMCVELMEECFKESFSRNQFEEKTCLDLGVGTADIAWRMAKAFPGIKIDGVDASEVMLNLGKKLIQEKGVEDQVHLICGYLPEGKLPQKSYDMITSNSLLHHLNDPMVLWESIKKFGEKGSFVFVMDLMRPSSQEEAKEMVLQYANDEAAILKRDFYNSLLAAYSVDEVEEQLKKSSLQHLKVKTVSDRHFVVYGKV